MICKKCGTQNPENSKFCQGCGAKLETSGTDVSHDVGGNNAAISRDIYNRKQKTQISDIPEEYKPISMWGYFGYEILFSIPLVGLILLLVFSFGGAKNKNLRNFARSYFCFLIVVVIICIIVLFEIGSNLSYM